jgi:hypothetical protein
MSQNRRNRKPAFQVEALETKKLMTIVLPSTYTVQTLGQMSIPGTQDVLKVENLITTAHYIEGGGGMQSKSTTVQRDEILGPTPVTLASVPGHPGVVAIETEADASATPFFDQFLYEGFRGSSTTFGNTTVNNVAWVDLNYTFLTPASGTSLNINEDIGHAETYPAGFGNGSPITYM